MIDNQQLFCNYHQNISTWELICATQQFDPRQLHLEDSFSYHRSPDLSNLCTFTCVDLSKLIIIRSL